jgi:hypothetical protein
VPIITEERAPERRKRGGRGLWLLLLGPPAVVVILLAMAAIQPLQLGPYLLAMRGSRWPGFGWQPLIVHSRRPTSPAAPVRYNGHDNVVTGAGHGLVLGAGDWHVSITFIRGYRQL